MEVQMRMLIEIISLAVENAARDDAGLDSAAPSKMFRMRASQNTRLTAYSCA